ncbi:MAG: hypothetical protein KAS32_30330 [Candidatus Peribacteraceae bacterium]|nr:hypothetical protein [Candidatus Peribacteraceae bacterium]
MDLATIIILLLKIYFGVAVVNILFGFIFVFLINWPIYKEFEDRAGFIGFNLAGLLFIVTKPHKLLYSAFASLLIFVSIFIGSIINPNYFPMYYDNLGPRIKEEYDRYILLKMLTSKGEVDNEEEAQKKEAGEKT